MLEIIQRSVSLKIKRKCSVLLMAVYEGRRIGQHCAIIEFNSISISSMISPSGLSDRFVSSANQMNLSSAEVIKRSFIHMYRSQHKPRHSEEQRPDLEQRSLEEYCKSHIVSMLCYVMLYGYL